VLERAVPAQPRSPREDKIESRRWRKARGKLDEGSKGQREKEEERRRVGEGDREPQPERPKWLPD